MSDTTDGIAAGGTGRSTGRDAGNPFGVSDGLAPDRAARAGARAGRDGGRAKAADEGMCVPRDGREEPVGGIAPSAASRFLGQATFSASDESIAEVQRLGYAGWLDAEMAREPSGSRVGWLQSKGYFTSDNQFSMRGFEPCVWRKLIRAPDELRQRVTLALSEIFVINPGALPDGGGFTQFAGAAYLDLLERHAFGSYRELLGDVTRSVQMGIYLSLRGSRRGDETGRAPDENYAREVLQLFSIGLYELNQDGSRKSGPGGGPMETYVQDDIVGLARAFTGWDVDRFVNGEFSHWRRPMAFFPEYHEPGEKRFLGTTIPAGTDGETALDLALDRIATHPNVGPFIGRQLIQRLVTSNPSPAYVRRVARAFADDGEGRRGNLGAVIRAVLLDPEARDASAARGSETFGKVREPIVRLTQWARTFRAGDPKDEYNLYDFSDPARQLGQSPSRSPSVFNFFRPGYVPPGTAIGRRGLVAPELQITSESSVVGYANFMLRAIRSGLEERLAPNYGPELRLVGEPAELVARLDLLLSGGQLEEATRTAIADAVETIPDDTDEKRRERVHAAILMVMVSPDYLVQR